MLPGETQAPLRGGCRSSVHRVLPQSGFGSARQFMSQPKVPVNRGSPNLSHGQRETYALNLPCSPGKPSSFFVTKNLRTGIVVQAPRLPAGTRIGSRTTTRNFSMPFIRYRRATSEVFQDGFPRRVRQHLSFELGVVCDLRAEVAQLKRQVAALAAELAKQKAIGAKARVLAPAPPAVAGPPRRRPAIAPPASGSRPAQIPIPRVSEPVAIPPRPIRGRASASEDTEQVIVLIADKNWP